MKMITLKSIISDSVFTLQSTQTIAKAFEIMAEKAISSIVVVDPENRPIGIFTEHDALRVVAEAINMQSLLSEEMTPSPFCVEESLYLHDAYAMMEEKGYRHVIVVDENGKFAGVVSEGDFLRHIGFEQLNKFKMVSEAMSESPLIVRLDTPLVEAAGAMKDRKVDYAVVLDGNHPVGLITERDIAHWYVHENEASAVTVERLLHREFRIIQKNIPLQEAAALMEEHGIHQLIVEDEKGNLVGLLSRHDVLHAVHGAYFEFLIRVIDQKNNTITQMDERRQQLRDEKKSIEKAAKALEKQNTFVRTLLDNIPDLVFAKDLEGRYIAGNKMFERFFGAEESDIIGKTDFDFVEPELAQFFRDNDKAAISIGRPRNNEEYLQFADGSYTGMFEVTKVPMRDGSGVVSGLLGIARDITQRKLYEDRLETLANYDPLTGLANRALLQSHLQSSIDKAKRHQTQMALLMFDLDRFKDINDSYGHSAGDELLQMVSKRFSQRLRDGDMISRLGGDEFAVVIENTVRPEDAGKLAEEMIGALAQEYRLSGGAVIHVGSSVGIAVFPNNGKDSSTLLQNADAALYKAKSEGRGVYRYYTDELTESARKRIECETRLRRAVINKEFEVYYQPQVHIATGRIVGAEALIRWNDPTRGIIAPLEFIPIAEETGLIGEIGEWVLNETCRQGKIWLDQGHRLTLAVNLSAHQIRHQDIPEMVEYALEASGYPADRLELELTESALMQREEESVEMLHALRAHGIRLAIDDFGTGYSSLAYLKRFPIDVLKIDKSFVDDIPFESDDMAIVTAIIAMAQALGFQVLAEGTECIEQIEFLKEKGCTMYQGYFKSQPVPAEEFIKLLG